MRFQKYFAKILNHVSSIKSKIIDARSTHFGKKILGKFAPHVRNYQKLLSLCEMSFKIRFIQKINCESAIYG